MTAELIGMTDDGLGGDRARSSTAIGLGRWARAQLGLPPSLAPSHSPPTSPAQPVFLAPMSRRFAASVYKNALPSPVDKQLWYHDLPLSSDDPNAVRASSSWIIAASSSVGGLVCIGWDDTGKTTDTKRGGEWNALGGKIWALDVVEDGDGQTTVMVGGQGGVSPQPVLSSSFARGLTTSSAPS